jgi:hypothetical protein
MTLFRTEVWPCCCTAPLPVITHLSSQPETVRLALVGRSRSDVS